MVDAAKLGTQETPARAAPSRHLCVFNTAAASRVSGGAPAHLAHGLGRCFAEPPALTYSRSWKVNATGATRGEKGRSPPGGFIPSEFAAGTTFPAKADAEHGKFQLRHLRSGSATSSKTRRLLTGCFKQSLQRAALQATPPAPPAPVADFQHRAVGSAPREAKNPQPDSRDTTGAWKRADRKGKLDGPFLRGSLVSSKAGGIRNESHAGAVCGGGGALRGLRRRALRREAFARGGAKSSVLSRRAGHTNTAFPWSPQKPAASQGEKV